jgi:hypothetical protein
MVRDLSLVSDGPVHGKGAKPASPTRPTSATKVGPSSPRISRCCPKTPARDALLRAPCLSPRATSCGPAPRAVGCPSTRRRTSASTSTRGAAWPPTGLLPSLPTCACSCARQAGGPRPAQAARGVRRPTDDGYLAPPPRRCWSRPPTSRIGRDPRRWRPGAGAIRSLRHAGVHRPWGHRQAARRRRRRPRHLTGGGQASGSLARLHAAAQA